MDSHRQLAVAANQRHVFRLVVCEQPVPDFALRELGFCRFTRSDISRDDENSADFAALGLAYGGYVTFDPYDVFVFAHVPEFSTKALACFDGLSKHFSRRFLIVRVQHGVLIPAHPVLDVSLAHESLHRGALVQ